MEGSVLDYQEKENNVNQGADIEKNVNRLFNILTFIFALFLLITQIYIVIAMFVGIVAPVGVPFNIRGIIDVINDLKLELAIGNGGSKSGVEAIAFGGLAIVFLVVLIINIVGIIKAVIRIFKYFKRDNEFTQQKFAIDKFAGFAKTSFIGVVFFIATSFAISYKTYITSAGIAAIVLICLCYLIYASLTAIYGNLINSDNCSRDWLAFATSLVKSCALVIVAFVLCANIKITIHHVMLNITSIGETFTENAASKYFNITRCFVVLIPYLLSVILTGNIINSCRFIQTKNKTRIGEISTILLILVIILSIVDCLTYKAAYQPSGSNSWLVQKYWLSYILASLGGAIVGFASKSNVKNI